MVHFATDVEECKRRARERKDHPTLDPENSDRVIGKLLIPRKFVKIHFIFHLEDEFAAGFKPPHPKEASPQNYEHLFTIIKPEESDETISKIKQLF